MNTPQTIIPALQDLVVKRIEAKRQEDAAAEIRKELDKQIAETMRDIDRDATTVSMKLSDVGLKVAVGFGVNRRVDNAAVQTKWETLPPELQACFRFKAEVVEANVKLAIEQGKADQLAPFITTTPASPSVKVEVI